MPEAGKCPPQAAGDLVDDTALKPDDGVDFIPGLRDDLADALGSVEGEAERVRGIEAELHDQHINFFVLDVHFFYGRDRDADLIFAGDIAGDDDAGAPEIHGELRHVEAGLARILASHSAT